ncbi:hypothetical protein ONS95_002081 [Cadophora gregata]|uniref:uncharacterized protein n=1 Tax=Cadophora gregata TaxID=51156 RepID=UPI0026DC967E|nr:uncharacterized protein ONS95_002081 [Cadophora gregata]KAK0111743.1 hypothetical protein ONS95_002081 [Cadophora gregata]KAK0111783.1 hypothetical protein ONS96_001052 [Cadophora gregata f. sp. sojae]
MAAQALSLSVNDTASQLSEALQEELYNWPESSDTYFIPNNKVDDLVDIEHVRAVLEAIHSSLSGPRLDDLSHTICSKAKKLFALLLMSNKIQILMELLDESITDLDLPFSKILLDKSKPSSTLYRLGRRSHDTTCTHIGNDRRCYDYCSIKTFVNQRSIRDKAEVRTLCSLQWSLLAPVFRNTGGKIKHYDLQYNIILPYIKDDDGSKGKIKYGGFSQVRGVKIHPTHQKLLLCPNDVNPVIAIKSLNNPDRTLFKRESEMLSDLTSSRHPNLVNLLATYTHKNKDHLMFPYADCNLREYWQAIPSPHWNKPVAVWAIKQMRGLVDATCVIHNFQPTHPLEPALPSPEVTQEKPFVKRLRVTEEKYGRHGDLKPENILCTKNLEDGSMDLQITDLGLGKFHGLDSRSISRPTDASPTYASPEIELDRPVSRMYDIWSMGCIFLELITWLMEGRKGLEIFQKRRFEFLNPNVGDDTYYTIKRTGDSKHAVLRPSVSSWIAGLRQSPRCSGMITDVLDLVQERMLKGGASERLCAHCLNAKFAFVLDRAMTDTGYLLQPFNQIS